MRGKSYAFSFALTWIAVFQCYLLHIWWCCKFCESDVRGF